MEGTYSRSRSHHPVWKDVEIQTHQLEDVFKQADDLKSQHVLGTGKSNSKHQWVNNVTIINHKDTINYSWGGRGSDLSAVISHFKDGRLPADLLGLLFAFNLLYRIWVTLQTWGKTPLWTILSLCTWTPTFTAVGVSSTFFFQLADSTPLYFKLGQVGSFSSTTRRHRRDILTTAS